MDVVMDYEAPDTFYRAGEGGRLYRGGKIVVGDSSYLMHLFRKGKEACEDALGSRTEGQPKDAVARRWVVVVGSRSWATSGLTRGGR
jgi:uncharacterized protein YgbK (DUF1537 family)